MSDDGEKDRLPNAKTFDTLVETAFASIKAQQANTMQIGLLVADIRRFMGLVAAAVVVVLVVNVTEWVAMREVSSRLDRVELILGSK